MVLSLGNYIHTGSKTHSLLLNWASPVVKQLERKENSSVFSSYLEKAWSYTSAPIYIYGVKFN
jgi:hypothetical protein